jgi:hypothetical protein
MAPMTSKIALRREGMWWVAYYAANHRQIELSRMRLNIAEQDEAVKNAFIEFNKLILQTCIEKVGGSVDFWETRPAPETERSGNA